MKLADESEANAAFETWLDLVAQGETVLVSRHGKVVARIEPCADAEADPHPHSVGATP